MRILLAVLAICIVHTVSAAADDGQVYATSYRYEKAGNYGDAIKSLMVAEEKQYLYNLRLGWLHYLAGNHANSRAAYLQAIQFAPKAVEPRLGYTLPLLAQERYAEVEQVARQVLMRDADNYYGSLRLSFALRMQKKLPQAEAICDNLVALYPSDVSVLVEKGLVEAALGERTNAARTFQRVLLLDPENTTAQFQLNR